MKWIDYREMLGLGVNDTFKYETFRNKLSISLHDLAKNAEKDSFNQTWQQILYDYYYCVGNERVSYFRDDFVDNIVNCESVESILCRFVAFANAFCKRFKNQEVHKVVWDMLFTALDDVKICYEKTEDDDGVFIFPKGAKELDDALVSQPLQWLSSYPNSHKAFVRALKEYSNADADKASEVADLFRKSLEAFFQEFFGGNKALEKYKKEYGDYLKKHGVPGEISNNFETLLQAYTNYMNNYAKHRDATSDKVLEYLMYQTGNIIRLVITLK